MSTKLIEIEIKYDIKICTRHEFRKIFPNIWNYYVNQTN